MFGAKQKPLRNCPNVSISCPVQEFRQRPPPISGYARTAVRARRWISNPGAGNEVFERVERELHERYSSRASARCWESCWNASTPASARSCDTSGAIATGCATPTRRPGICPLAQASSRPPVQDFGHSTAKAIRNATAPHGWTRVLDAARTGAKFTLGPSMGTAPRCLSSRRDRPQQRGGVSSNASRVMGQYQSYTHV